jgi:hypothetical protein
MREKTLPFLMLFAILIGVFSVLLPNHTVAGAIFVPKWEKAFGGTGDEEAMCIVNASDGGYLLGGWTTSFGAGDKDFWIVKVSESGIMEWNKTYGGTAQDYLCSIVPADDGGYLLGGSTFSFGAGTKDIWLIKTDSIGNALWNKTYGWYEYDDISVPGSITKTMDGGYAIAATTRSYAVGGEDALLIKINSTGFVEWNQTYSGPNYDRFYTVLQTNDGGYMCGGWTRSYGEGAGTYWNSWLVRTDSSGNALWNVTYGGPYDDAAFGMTEAGNNEYVFAGTFGNDGSSVNAWWFKTNSSGNLMWNITSKGEGLAGIYSIANANDSGFALCGITRSISQSGWDVWLVKIDASGSVEWNATYEGTGDDRAYSFVNTADGGYLMAGSTNSLGSGGTDFLLVKFGADVLAPEIGTPSQDPPRNDVQPDQNVIISANVTDVESGVKNATLFYSLDNGTTWEEAVPMNLNTTSGLYEGTIPGQPIGTWVRFKIEAFDKAGNNVTKDGTSLDNTYMVVPEFPSILVLPVFMIASLLSVIIYNRRRSSYS